MCSSKVGVARVQAHFPTVGVRARVCFNNFRTHAHLAAEKHAIFNQRKKRDSNQSSC